MARVLRERNRQTNRIRRHGSQQSPDNPADFRKGETKMSERFKFFQKILTQLNKIQTELNTLRATIKEEIQNSKQK